MKPKLGDTRNKLIISYVNFLKWKVKREFQVYELCNNVPRWIAVNQKINQHRPVSTFTDHDPGKAFGGPIGPAGGHTGYGAQGPSGMGFSGIGGAGFSGYSTYSGCSNSEKNNV